MKDVTQMESLGGSPEKKEFCNFFVTKHFSAASLLIKLKSTVK